MLDEHLSTRQYVMLPVRTITHTQSIFIGAHDLLRTVRNPRSKHPPLVVCWNDFQMETILVHYRRFSQDCKMILLHSPLLMTRCCSLEALGYYNHSLASVLCSAYALISRRITC
jgi:hypothetical protein